MNRYGKARNRPHENDRACPRTRPRHPLDAQAPARARGAIGRRDPLRARHRRHVQGGVDPQREEGAGTAGAGRRQRVLGGEHADAHELRARRPCRLSRRDRFLGEGEQRLQGRDAHRHGPQHRGDGRRRDRDPPPGGRGRGAVVADREVQRRQRRRRRARAPDAGPARPVHDARAVRADRGAAGGDRRRRGEQPGGAVEPVRADEARGGGGPRRPADAAAAVVRAARRGSCTTSTQ